MAVPWNAACPLPLPRRARVLLAHGGGGRIMRDLIESVFVPAFRNPLLEKRHDGAVFPSPPWGRLAFTTDSYVVKPLFFAGGDIGSLAVNGTVNDLAMCGARPLYLSAGFILEEGLPMEDLERVVRSMSSAAAVAGVMIVTGDTKVVDKGKGDGLFVNTAGVGVLEHDLIIGPEAVRPGDAILVSGDIGRHGVAILAARESLGFETTIESDCAPLAGSVLALLESGIEVHGLRDLTRGGLGAALCELAEVSELRFTVEESRIPVREDVAGACEILGLDPLYVANEGKLVAIVAPNAADAILAAMQEHPLGREARLIGTVTGEHRGMVTVRTPFATTRIVDMLAGDQLPRIC